MISAFIDRSVSLSQIGSICLGLPFETANHGKGPIHSDAAGGLADGEELLDGIEGHAGGLEGEAMPGHLELEAWERGGFMNDICEKYYSKSLARV